MLKELRSLCDEENAKSFQSVSLGKPLHPRVRTGPVLQSCLQGELRLRRGKACSFLGNTVFSAGGGKSVMDQIHFPAVRHRFCPQPPGWALCGAGAVAVPRVSGSAGASWSLAAGQGRAGQGWHRVSCANDREGAVSGCCLHVGIHASHQGRWKTHFARRNIYSFSDVHSETVRFSMYSMHLIHLLRSTSFAGLSRGQG